MHFEKLRKGIPFELGFPHMNRPGSLTLVNPLWPHGFFCSWKENERKMKRKWKQWATLRYINTKQGPKTLLTLLTLWGGGEGGFINPLLALCAILTSLCPDSAAISAMLLDLSIAPSKFWPSRSDFAYQHMNASPINPRYIDSHTCRHWSVKL